MITVHAFYQIFACVSFHLLCIKYLSLPNEMLLSHPSRLSSSPFSVSLPWSSKPSSVISLSSLVAQMVKHLPTVRETWVRSLSWEDRLEKEMATHLSTLAWKIPWTEERSSLQSVGSQSAGHD